MTDQQNPGAWNQGGQQPYAPPPQPAHPQQTYPQQQAVHQAASSHDENGVRYGIGPFTIREVIVLALTVLLLIASFLPLLSGEALDYADSSYTSLWTPVPLLAIPGVLFSVVAGVLVLLRRLVPSTNWRTGSLSVDQFASVSSILAAATQLALLFVPSGIGGLFSSLSGYDVDVSDYLQPGVGVILGFIIALALVVFTTFGSLIPPFREDFTIRPETVARPAARAVPAVPRRPQSVAPQPAFPPAAGYPQGGYTQQAPQQQGYPQAGQQQSGYPQQGGYPQSGYQQTGYQQTGAVPSYVPQQAADAPAPAPATDRAPAASDAPAQPRPEPAPSEPALNTPEPSEPESPEAEAPSDASDAASLDGVVAEGAASDETITDDAASPAAEAPGEEQPAEQPVADEALEADQSPDAQTAPPVSGPFWVLAPEPRDVVDAETGATVFTIGPTAWALALEDRGSELLIRSDDGALGVLSNTEGLTRG